MRTNSEKNSAFLIHLSAFLGYFIPLGNVLFPLIIWNIKKDESEFVNQNGKEAVNFNLSFLLYYTILIISLFPLFFSTVIKFATQMEHLEHMESLHHLTGVGGIFSFVGILLLF